MHSYQRSDADIAILVMESSVRFTNFIQPICLPSSSQNVNNVEGIVAGYGRSGRYDPPTEIPYHLKLVTDELVQCYASYENSPRYLSLRSFCANNTGGVLCAGK